MQMRILQCACAFEFYKVSITDVTMLNTRTPFRTENRNENVLSFVDD